MPLRLSTDKENEIIVLRNAGREYREIASHIPCDIRTVHRVCRVYEKDGGALDKLRRRLLTRDQLLAVMCDWIEDVKARLSDRVATLKIYAFMQGFTRDTEGNQTTVNVLSVGGIGGELDAVERQIKELRAVGTSPDVPRGTVDAPSLDATSPQREEARPARLTEHPAPRTSAHDVPKGDSENVIEEGREPPTPNERSQLDTSRDIPENISAGDSNESSEDNKRDG